MKLKQTLLPLVIAGLVTACIGGKRTTPSEESSSLKAAFGNKFLIGAALNQRQVSGEDTAAIAIAKHRRGELHEMRGHPSGGKPV